MVETTFDGVVKIQTEPEPDRIALPRIILDGSSGSIGLASANGKRVMFLDPNGGGPGGEYSALFLGEGKAGIMVIRDHLGRDTITMDGKYRSIAFKDAEGRDGIVIQGINQHIILRDDAGNDSIWMSGNEGTIQLYKGDILLNNADCAEDFDIADSESIEPGTVMVIDQEGKLKQSSKTYDKRVAGVISGAGDYKPGLVLDKKQSHNSRKSISLMGKVYCKVDAEPSPLEVGDLLTTSTTPGHAMKADDPTRAFGAIIGKALLPLKSGRGLIPILIALQ